MIKRKLPKLKFIIFGILVLLLALSPVTPVFAQDVGLGHGFYGTVEIDGEGAEIGSVISAQIGETEYGSCLVATAGQYALIVQGEIADEATINFYINGQPADQTFSFHDGWTTQMDLTVPATPPTVATSAASSISTTTATLNGDLANLGTALSVAVSFEWGTSTSYGTETTTQTRTTEGSFSAALSGLSASTTYHFKAVAVGDGTTYGADRTFTTATPAAGGGGGGGFVPGPPAGTTDVSGIVSTAGIFQETTTAISEDGLCTLGIPDGTVGLTADLEPLDEITILEMDDPPAPPEDASVIGLTYDFGPDGATFDPPITLTFSYDPADIPEGVAEEDMVIAWYDEATGEWIELEGCVVDPETNTITAPVSHFTAFGVMFIPVPAAFSLSTLAISPAEAEIGSTVTISAVAENTGGERGICKVTLKIDGKVEEAKYATIDPGASTQVSFTVSRDTAGSYAVDVNGLTGSFTVKEGPAPPPTPPPAPPPAPPAQPINWPVLWGVIAAVVAFAAIILTVLRRRHD